MRTVTRSTLGLLVLFVAILSRAPARAQADDPEAYGDGYQAGNYGRVRYVEKGATIERSAEGRDAGGERADVNSPIFPGDTVLTSGDERVEIQLAGGTLVRVDRNSTILLQSLPDPYAKYQDNTVLILRAGALRITSRLSGKQEFRVDTEASSVYLLGDGEFRIETGGAGRTGVASFRGVAEVGGASGSVLVRGGTATSVDPGSVPNDPTAFHASAQDGFDRWCDARDAAYGSRDQVAQRREDAPREEDVPEEVRPYYGELSTYGTWTDVPQYGAVWYPSGVAPGWRPYFDGGWSYGPGGYFWVGAEPWGWAPYHYGCWQWVASFGWCWVPGHVFGGAWVSWSWGSAYVGWAPLDYWGRPCWMGGPRAYGVYDPGCWTFVGYGNVAAGNVRRYAVPVARVGGDLQHATVVSRAPRVAPREIARAPEARERALRLVGEDRGARMRPTGAGSAPDRRFLDMQSRLLHRVPAAMSTDRGTARGASASGGSAPPAHAPAARQAAVTGRSSPAEAPQHGYPRRIYDDPRTVERAPARSAPGYAPSPRTTPAPDSREHVRDFYERMSRPRQTQQEPHPGYQPARPRAEAPAPSYEAPRAPYAQPRATYAPPHAAPQAPRPQGPAHGGAPAAPRPKDGHKGR